MDLKQRISVLAELGTYMMADSDEWLAAKRRAQEQNGWFTDEFIQLAISNISQEFLKPEKLAAWTTSYQIPLENHSPKTVGIIMAGNIPLVGFHDFLCGFICGHTLILKPSSRDTVLIKHLVEKLAALEPRVNEQVVFADQLKGCDAYIATGSNNSGRYFEYYFRNYTSIIRKNRTSVAVLTGEETAETLKKLADDIFLFFGLGCRNVSKLYVPKGYDFVPLLAAFDSYKWMADHAKFKNNYDYNLSIHLLNHQYYMTNGTALLIENKQFFSPICQVNYEFYDTNPGDVLKANHPDEIQCVVAKDHTDFGNAQSPAITDYADGVDTLTFMLEL